MLLFVFLEEKSERLEFIRFKFDFCIYFKPGVLQVKSSHGAILRFSFHWQFPRGQVQVNFVAVNYKMKINVTQKYSLNRSLCLNLSAQLREHIRFPLPVRQSVLTAMSFAKNGYSSLIALLLHKRCGMSGSQVTHFPVVFVQLSSPSRFLQATRLRPIGTNPSLQTRRHVAPLHLKGSIFSPGSRTGQS